MPRITIPENLKVLRLFGGSASTNWTVQATVGLVARDMPFQLIDTLESNLASWPEADISFRGSP